MMTDTGTIPLPRIPDPPPADAWALAAQLAERDRLIRPLNEKIARAEAHLRAVDHDHDVAVARAVRDALRLVQAMSRQSLAVRSHGSTVMVDGPDSAQYCVDERRHLALLGLLQATQRRVTAAGVEREERRAPLLQRIAQNRAVRDERGETLHGGAR